MVKKIVATLLFFLSLYVPAYAAGMPAVELAFGKILAGAGLDTGTAG